MIAKEYGLSQIASVQNCYNLINHGFEFGLAEIACRENVGLLAYSPLAFGHLMSKYQAPKALERAMTMQQLEENIGAWDKPLSEELLGEIEQLHLRYMNPAPCRR